MPKLTPKKTFLLRNEVKEGHKKATDTIAHKGVSIDVTNEEAVKFAGYWDVSDDKEKKKVTDAAKLSPNAKRIV
jgi:hypothetical protein